MDRYPMGDDQPAQIDCRFEAGRFHQDAKCTNVAPAITLTPDKIFVCWSMETGPADGDLLSEKALSALGFYKVIPGGPVPGYWIGLGANGGEMWPRLEVRFAEYKRKPFGV